MDRERMKGTLLLSAYFQDTSYFIKTFKKKKGATPSEYRKEKGTEL